MELSQCRFEPLREDDEFILYRAHSALPGAPPVLFLTPSSARPAPQTLKKLEHEYALRNELDATWAARPIALTQFDKRTGLVLEDPRGEPLNRLIEGPMEMRQFLRFAVGVATALNKLHKQELIHKDLKPPNVLVDSATGQVWLTGFGIASGFRVNASPPNLLSSSPERSNTWRPSKPGE